jgi:hypothetical protein
MPLKGGSRPRLRPAPPFFPYHEKTEAGRTEAGRTEKRLPFSLSHGGIQGAETAEGVAQWILELQGVHLAPATDPGPDIARRPQWRRLSSLRTRCNDDEDEQLWEQAA